MLDSLRVAGVSTYPAMYGSAIAARQFGPISLTLPVSGDFAFPLTSLPNRQTVYCNEDGTFVTYRSDSLGFNNDDAAWTAIDAVAIGDAYVAGACVPGDRDLVGALRRTSRESCFGCTSS